VPTEISLGEFEHLVTKAFRGAGYPWGLATDAAFACRQLEAVGLPAADAAMRLLDQMDGLPTANVMPGVDWRSPSGVLCPVCSGAAACDLGDDLFANSERRTIEQVAEPLLLVALLSLSPVVTEGRSVVVQWPGGHAEVTTRSLLHNGSVPSGVLTVEITRIDDTATPMAPTQTRAFVGDSAHQALLRYAARTYAPATEESRSGAGAGLSDNN